MQLVVIDPDMYSAQVIAFAARRRGHRAMLFGSVDEIPARGSLDASVIILAIESTARSALSPLRALRERFKTIPIISVCGEFELSADGVFEAGASQMIIKPFYPTELIVRSEVLAESHAGSVSVSDVITVGDLEVDLRSYTATKNGRQLVLTKLELRLLYSLARHHRSVSPTETLVAFGWDSVDPPNDALLKTHISHLRAKLRDAGGFPATIQSRHSLGYVLTVADPVEGTGPAA